MKRLLQASFLTVGLSLSAFAADSTPVDTKGNETPAAYAGSSTCMITSSTGTAAVLCTSGSGIILQVIASSVTTTDYLTLRDSATANTTSTELSRIQNSGLPGIYVYPRFKNGLSVNASAIPGPGASGAWTIIYTKDLR